MTSMLTEPRAMNILIDARIEQLRGGRRPAEPDPASAPQLTQRSARTLRRKCAAGRAPITVSAGAPSAKRITVGIESTS